MKTLLRSGFLILVSVLLLLLGTQDIFSQVKRKTTRRVTVTQYTVPSGTRIRVRINETLSSKTGRVGDRFTTTVREPVYNSNGVLLIPVGSVINGRINAVRPAQKGGDPGTIDVGFVSLTLPNGKVRLINGSLYDLAADKSSSDNEGTATGQTMKHRKLIFIGGGAAGGAVIGAMIGGKKGAVIGGLLGAGAGILGEKLTHGSEAEVKSGDEFGVYLNRSVLLPRWVEPVAQHR